MTTRVLTPARGRAALVVAAGLAVGVLTLFGQSDLNGTLNPLVNSASVWLVAPFLVGILMPSHGAAAIAGLVCCLLEVVGYDITAELHGPVFSGSLDPFWAVCAVISGPAFGAAGQLIRDPRRWLRGLGPALLSAAFISEGAWNYAHQLHDTGAAILWIGIGLAIAVVTLRGWRDYRWLALTVPVGLIADIGLTRIIAEIGLTQIYL